MMKNTLKGFYNIKKLQLKLESLERINQELNQENQRLKQLVLLDPLTGIANRRYLEQSLQQEYKNSVRNSLYLGLLMIDLDRFKQYNDNYGHLAGDQLLIKVALSFNEMLHRPKDMLFRYGGEEFVCLLPNTTSQGVKRVAQTLLETARICGITISVGGICADLSQIKSPKRILELADRAMYQAKESGRDRLVFVNDS